MPATLDVKSEKFAVMYDDSKRALLFYSKTNNNLIGNVYMFSKDLKVLRTFCEQQIKILTSVWAKYKIEKAYRKTSQWNTKYFDYNIDMFGGKINIGYKNHLVARFVLFSSSAEVLEYFVDREFKLLGDVLEPKPKDDKNKDKEE